MGLEIRHRRRTPEQIREDLDRFEERYGVSRERRFEVFPGDGRCENDELAGWSKLYHAWKLVQQRRR
jgi:hypothetical protein